MHQKARVLIATGSRARANTLQRHLSFLPRGVDQVVGQKLPKSLAPYRLLICELDPKKLPSPDHLLCAIRPDAHVVLIVPDLSVASVAHQMSHPQINHILQRGCDPYLLQVMVDKLESGSIFGLDRYLPQAASIVYRRIDSFAQRSQALEEIDAYCGKLRMRGWTRRQATSTAEELLMNAMYQAPVDANGDKVFADISPSRRVRRKTPRPVSLRYTALEGRFYISVRDRFGTFQRNDLYRCLERCLNSKQQMERKKLGAGLGLYLIANAASLMVINILPASVAEFVVVVDAKSRKNPIQTLSVTAHRSSLI